MAPPLPCFALPILLLLIIIISSSTTVSGFVERYVNPGDSVKITVNGTCPTGDVLALIRLHQTDVVRPPTDVTKRVNGVWQEEETYSGRIAHDSAVSFIILKDVNSNDGGHYVVTCGGRDLPGPIQLKVAVPFDKVVHEGASATLPCHHATVAERVKRVRWEKDGDLVLEQDRSSSETAGSGRGRERKASVPEDWYSKGNLSLTLDGVRPEDEGNYVCYVVGDGTRKRGDPGNVRVTVNRRGDKLIASTTPTQTPEVKESSFSTRLIVSIAFNGLLLLLLAAGVICWLKTRTPGDAGPQREDRVLYHGPDSVCVADGDVSGH
uniref:uncharacterized protein LOC124054738 n=1 Tax=Scatophagus argus TaxID=75038 RepID=UPI001ED845CD|nr:uncharacterized protein LOC124054738 [Scatophagus argus]